MDIFYKDRSIMIYCINVIFLLTSMLEISKVEGHEMDGLTQKSIIPDSSFLIGSKSNRSITIKFNESVSYSNIYKHNTLSKTENSSYTTYENHQVKISEQKKQKANRSEKKNKIEEKLKIDRIIKKRNTNFTKQRKFKKSINIFKTAEKRQIKSGLGQLSNVNIDNNHLLRVALNGLNLKSLPDMGKVNISQKEYASMYREYIERLKYRNYKDPKLNSSVFKEEALDFFSFNTNISFIYYVRRRREMRKTSMSVIDVKGNNTRHKKNLKTTVLLKFSVQSDLQNLNSSHQIEDANVRLMIIHNLAKLSEFSHRRCPKTNNTKKIEKQTKLNKFEMKKKILRFKIFLILPNNKRRWIDESTVLIPRQLKIEEASHSQWIQFDVTNAVSLWLKERYNDLFLEIQCENCLKYGTRLLRDTVSFPLNNQDKSNIDLTPVLNIITRFGQGVSRHILNHNIMNNKTINEEYEEKSNCNNTGKRCCRHFMHVAFKNIKGFEFIIQPKTFDAGYCQGRCPPRYNPANHHAVLQSLIWRQDHKKVPRPCCAPSKLREMEVLHVDEKDSAKLKISTWSNMVVLECACS